MSVEVNYQLKLSTDETVDLDLDHTANPQLTHEIAADSGTLNASSTPTATKEWTNRVTLSGGAASIDLAALDKGNLPDEDFSGLEVRIVKLSAPSGNGAAITVTVGSSNGYNLLGPTSATADRMIVSPGCVVEHYLHNTAEAVDATHKTIDFAGAGTDVLDVQLAAGAD